MSIIPNKIACVSEERDLNYYENISLAFYDSILHSCKIPLGHFLKVEHSLLTDVSDYIRAIDGCLSVEACLEGESNLHLAALA